MRRYLRHGDDGGATVPLRRDSEGRRLPDYPAAKPLAEMTQEEKADPLCAKCEEERLVIIISRNVARRVATMRCRGCSEVFTVRARCLLSAL